MQCIKHIKVVQRQKVKALSMTEVTACFHNGRQDLLSMTSLAMSQAASNFKPWISSKNEYIIFWLLLIESYDRTTDKLWWIWHTSWLRMINMDDTLAFWDMSVEWMTKPRVNIQCWWPPIQTDVKLCLIDRFTFIAKTLIKPGDIVR